jgi:hypothetical protein
MLALVSGGCQVLGAAAYVVTPPKIKAQYVPPKTPMVVLVENRQNPGMYVYSSDQLTGYIIDDLKTYEVCPLIPDEKLRQFMDSTPSTSKMTISQIGKAVGASQVLYVDLRHVSVGGIVGVPAAARAEAGVRVVDVATGKTMFPQTGEAYPISFQSEISQDATQQDMTQVRDAMAREAGADIARLFHDLMPG